MFTWTKRLLLTCTILGLLATNVLTLTSMAFNAALSGAIATATGIRTVSSMMQSKIANQKTTIKRQHDSAIKRTIPEVAIMLSPDRVPPKVNRFCTTTWTVTNR